MCREFNRDYAPMGSATIDATVAAGALAFTLSNPNQPSCAYSVHTLSRTWLPAGLGKCACLDIRVTST